MFPTLPGHKRCVIVKLKWGIKLKSTVKPVHSYLAESLINEYLWGNVRNRGTAFYRSGRTIPGLTDNIIGRAGGRIM